MEELLEYIKGVKGIIFDYGGTLDTDGTHWSLVIWEAWQKAGIATDLPTFREAYVYAERELARTRHILPEHDFNDLLKIKVNIQLQWLAHQNKYPAENVEPAASEIAGICNRVVEENMAKAKPLLESLSAKYPLVVVSNFYGNLTTVLEKYGILKYFVKVIESAVVGVKKPDPEIFRLGVEALKLHPEECLVVGDSYSKDIMPALETGCKAVWLKGKGWDGEEEKISYSPSIENLAELDKIAR